MEDKDFYWLVGVLEGEGCFTINHDRPRIVIKMVDLDVMERVARLLDSPAPRRSHPPSRRSRGWQPQFVVEFSGLRARDWMLRLEPHMGERRRARISEVLASTE